MSGAGGVSPPSTYFDFLCKLKGTIECSVESATYLDLISSILPQIFLLIIVDLLCCVPVGTAGNFARGYQLDISFFVELGNNVMQHSPNVFIALPFVLIGFGFVIYSMICMMRSQFLFPGALVHTIKGQRLRYIWLISTWRFTKARRLIVPDQQSRFDTAAQAYNRGQRAVLSGAAISLFGFGLMHLMALLMR